MQNTEWAWRIKQILETEATRTHKNHQRYCDWSHGVFSAQEMST